MADSFAASRHKVLIITGMHRSGTSLVARILERAGVDIGSDLVEADHGNRHGYYEDKDFVKFHDDVLSRSGRQIFVQEQSCLTLDEDDGHRAEELVGRRHGSGLWGWKDPRTSLFLDAWAELLPNARFVFMFRHPIDVVASLMRRDSDAEIEVRVDPLAGLRSWEIYNQAISSFFERRPEHCLLCNIYRVVEDPAELIRAARRKLELPLELEDLEGLVHRKDLHATLASPGVDAILRRSSPEAARLYRKLESKADLSSGSVPSPKEEPELTQRLETIANLLSGTSGNRVIARPLMAVALAVLDSDATSPSGHDIRSRLSKTESQIDKLQQHCDNLERLRKEDASLLRKLRSHGENLERMVAERSTTIHFLENRVAELESLHQASDRRASELRAHSESLQRLVAERDVALGDLHRHAANLEIDLGRSQSAIEGLEAHIENLESAHDRDQGQIREVSEHAANLEQELLRWQSKLEDLESHVGNLEAERTLGPDLQAELAGYDEEGGPAPNASEVPAGG